MRSLLTSLNTVAADEMQTILTVAEHLRSNWENEMERVKQAQKQYDELLARYDEAVKLWATDKEKIRKQRDEIGMKRHKFVIFLWFDVLFSFSLYFIQSNVSDSSVIFQIRLGANETQHFCEIKWLNRKCIRCERNSMPSKVP